MSIASEITRIQNAKKAVAMAINAKGGNITNERLESYAEAINALELDSGAALEPLTVQANGTYMPAAGSDGFSSVEVGVPLPALFPPLIVQNEILTEIRDTPDNGAFVSSYDIYIDGVFKENIAKIG